MGSYVGHHASASITSADPSARFRESDQFRSADVEVVGGEEAVPAQPAADPMEADTDSLDGAQLGSSASTRWTRGATTLAAASVVMGIANYAAALAMTRLVSAHEFSRYTAGQSLLLVLGTGSMAALPWAVSRFLVSPDYSRSRSEAMQFGLVGSTVQGVVLGLLALVVAWSIDGPAFGAAVGAAAFAISLLAGPVGFFQGDGRLVLVAALRLLETAVRIAVGIGLVLTVQRSAAVGLLGFTAGGVVAFGYAIWAGRYAFPLTRPGRAISLALAKQALLLGAVQVLLAMLAALDTVYVTIGHFSATDAASYQAASVIGRIPLFVSAAICTAAYPSMVAAVDEERTGRVLGASIRQYSWLTLPFVVACVSVPHELLYRLIPEQYTKAEVLLRLTCVLGALIGAVNVLSTAHQARAFYRSSITILGVVCVAQAVVLVVVGQLASVTVFATAGVIVVGGGLIALAVDGRRWLSPARVRISVAGVAATAVSGILVVLAGDVAIWFAGVALLGALSLVQAVRHPATQDIPMPATTSPSEEHS